MDLSVITVTQNCEKYIGEQIKSVKKACEGLEFEQIMTDNKSADSTVDFIKKNFPEIKLIVNEDNKGFGRANNQGAGVATGEFLLFLNPDMEMMGEGMMKKMIEEMKDDPKIGIMTCKLVDKSGRINEGQGPRRFPKVWEQCALLLKLPRIFPHIFDKYLYKDLDVEKRQSVDTARGSFMLMRAGLVAKLGGNVFDERYFLWFEEVDLCKEIKKLGYEVVYNPRFSCVDLVGQNFKTKPNLWKQKIFTKSMLVYFQKWEPFYKWMWIWLLRPVGIFMVWVRTHSKFHRRFNYIL